ncbi:glucosaminidase domain-containing protein [Marinobacter sp. CHS3-4]|uniref:glucosaminidase domain-containing protein n=1 Tax=Marinobacter sp. CHS3-4 TaxID=3045174 RepID=UPI0024B4C5E3|nr:glucosaminidase domain-containing protein [Marinobacter sp. CHS3-4]MDI9243879.1 glucosaminidase domain-containing protein [Marinobacter sp. CHS3-4]
MADSERNKKYGLIAGGVLVLVVLGFVFGGSSVPDFKDYEAGSERKDAFFGYFLPIIQEENAKIAEIREELLAWHEDPDSIGWWDEGTIQDIAADYGMDDFDVEDQAAWADLLRRVDIVPPSLALSQAANESAWGTSRFATKGNNYFGQWCFEKGCGLVPNSRDAGKTHEVADFDSPRQSVQRYMENLNTHNAYEPLRQVRSTLRLNGQPVTGYALAAGLGKYSERGAEYIEELRAMMRHNELAKHDL